MFIALCSGAAKANPTVEDFYGQCASLKIEDRAFCMGFLLGYLKAKTIKLVYEDGSLVTEDVICLNGTMTTDDLRQMFIDWAEQNSERADEDRWVGVLGALSSALPCD